MNPSPRTRRSRATRLAAFVTIAALALAACGDDTSQTGSNPAAPGATTTSVASAAPSTTDGTTDRSGGTLTIGLPTDPISVQPRGGGAGNDQLWVARQLFDSLLEQDPATGELLPWLAESWEVNADATEFTFHLRDDVTFSDGTPLTAQIVKENFDDAVDSGAKATWVAAFFAGFEEATVVDEHTVQVNFSIPSAAFPQAVSTSALGIFGAATLAVPFEERATRNLVGTGPFVLDSYTKDTEVVLSKREGYAWSPSNRTNPGEAYLDKLVFKIVPEAGVRTGALESKQVAAIGGVPPQDVEALRGRGFNILARSNPGVVFGIIPVQSRTPLDDVRVRQAIAHAIDTTDVRDTVLSEEFAVARSVLSQTTPGFVPVSGILTYDPDKAAALLDEAGWTLGSDGVRAKDGTRLELQFGWIQNFGPNQASLELIQAQLAESGIVVELKGSTAPEYIPQLQAGAFDLVWSNVSRADADILRASFSTAGANYYRFDDPDLEALLQKQTATGDVAARNQLVRELQELIVTQAFQIPVFELTTVAAYGEGVHDLSLASDSRLNQLTDAWVES